MLKLLSSPVILLVVCLVLSFNVKAQDKQPPDTTVLDSNAIYNMSLEQLMKIKESGVSSQLESLINSLIGVASKKALSLRKSPGIITLITQEEIEKSGARDLIDVLRLVPGIDIGCDVEGVVSIGIRGNWAAEGKVLLLLDGQEMNEILYSSIQLGNHFDVSQIKRIEIIRGPGSVIYGGYAEYGVINIITKDGEDLHGFSVMGTYGQMTSALGQQDLNVSYGNKIKDVDISFASFFGQGNRSDQTYTDLQGNSYNMAGNSNLNPTNVNLGISYKGLSFRGIYDDYETTTRDNYGSVLSQAYPNNFTSEYLELKYVDKISDKLSITPLINFKNQTPWNFVGTTAQADQEQYSQYDITAQRYRANITALYDPTPKINITAGGEAYYDYASIGQGDTTVFNNGNNSTSKSISYTNEALFTQILIRNKVLSFILGARYENNSGYGSDFVPRVGIIQRINTWNFKLLYSSSFKAPSIEDVQFAIYGIKPETTNVIELEASHQIGEKMFLTLNFYDITTNNPIVYGDTVVSGIAYDYYKNESQSGSRGMELDYKVKDNWGYLDFNFSLYTLAGKPTLAGFAVPTDNTQALGFATNKFNLSACYNISKHFSIAPTISFIGSRYGYAYVGGRDSLKQFSPTILANLFLQYNSLMKNKLKIGVGCFNILNEDDIFIQPYNGGHAPLPGPSREFTVRLTYLLNFKK